MLERCGLNVFSEIKLRRFGQRLAGESHFSYLDNSAETRAIEIRQVVESWIRNYPQDRLGQWLGNFKSDNNEQNSSAFFELFLFQFFRANGCAILGVEPDICGIEGNPDFLIKHPSLGEIVVEAVSPSRWSDAERGKRKLVDEIRDAINAIKLENQILILKQIVAPEQAIDKSKLVSELKLWIKEVPSQGEEFLYKDRGGLIRIEIVPSNHRNVESPRYGAIGLELEGGSVTRPGYKLKKALDKKAKIYKALKVPYLIAINSQLMEDSEDDYLAATYGTEAASYRFGPNGLDGTVDFIRNFDGLFNEGDKARKRHVSAVIFFDGVASWNWGSRRSCILHNAAAARTLHNATFGGDAYLIDQEKLRRVEGVSVAQLFSESSTV